MEWKVAKHSKNFVATLLTSMTVSLLVTHLHPCSRWSVHLLMVPSRCSTTELWLVIVLYVAHAWITDQVWDAKTTTCLHTFSPPQGVYCSSIYFQQICAWIDCFTDGGTKKEIPISSLALHPKNVEQIGAHLTNNEAEWPMLAPLTLYSCSYMQPQFNSFRDVVTRRSA